MIASLCRSPQEKKERQKQAEAAKGGDPSAAPEASTAQDAEDDQQDEASSLLGQLSCVLASASSTPAVFVVPPCRILSSVYAQVKGIGCPRMYLTHKHL
jgi:hypothetical protein